MLINSSQPKAITYLKLWFLWRKSRFFACKRLLKSSLRF